MDEAVEIFEGLGCSSKLDDLKDPVSGKYRVPVPLNLPALRELMKGSIKYLEKQSYMEKLGAREEDFESEWPSIWAKWEEGPKDGEQLPKRFMAVLDTGYMTEHPLLQDCVEETVDFTGEGIEDQNGHGTGCALLSIMPYILPDRFKLRLLVVKVAGKDGRGSPENLIKGLQWLTQFKNERSLEEGDLLASLSLGVYSRRWGAFGCRGDCVVCKAAIEAARQGIIVTAAAGNKPGMTACPARAAVASKQAGLVAVGASDYANSGVGTLMMPAGHVGFAEIDVR